MKMSNLTLLALCATLSSCANRAQATLPIDAFLAALSPYCGKAFAGKIVANEPAAQDDAFVGKTLIMHVRDCSADRFNVPFHVGEDHSRTWQLTAKAGRLQLKHEHRHADGKLDTLTNYGGTSVSQSLAKRVEFPVDAESKTLFAATNRQVSMTNVWALELDRNQQFIYELTRTGRVFRVAFDLTKSIEIPIQGK